MKKTKYISISFVLGFCVFLAIAAFPPNWASTQFQSIGGYFSMKSGALQTNITVWRESGGNVDMLTFADTQLSFARSAGAKLLLYDNASEGDVWLASGDGITNFVDTTIQSGNLVISTAGNGLQIKEGSDAKMGTATLVNGMVTVSTTAVTASSRIFLTKQVGAGAVRAPLEVGTVTAGTSFVIQAVSSDGSVSADDVSTVGWVIIEPAP